MEEKTPETCHQQSSLSDTQLKPLKESWKALRSLPRGYREVAVMFYFGGYTDQEISKVLNLPLNVVKRRLRIAQKHLSIDLDSMIAQLKQMGM